MKKSLDAYGPFPSSIRSSLRFSSMNFFAAINSSAGSLMAFAGRVAGASGLRSIAWSYGRCGGNRSDAFSLNTFVNVKGTCVALLSPTCTGPLGRVKSSPLYLLSRRQRERPLLSPMTCTPDLEYLGSSVGTTRIDDASKSRDVDATCDHLTCDLLLL
jgi:hypothetical protein